MNLLTDRDRLRFDIFRLLGFRVKNGFQQIFAAARAMFRVHFVANKAERLRWSVILSLVCRDFFIFSGILQLL